MSWELRYEPRQWQKDALDIWREKRQGVLSVVTGAGKTIFAQICMLDTLQELPATRFFIVVPTIALLDQWFISLIEDLNVPQSEISQYSGQGHAKKPSKINLLVLNTARTHIDKITKGNSNFLIVDECHKAGSKENAKALVGRWSATLGISATPVREYDDGFENKVVPVLGPIIYEYDYNQAKEDDVIVPFDLLNVKIDLLEHEDLEYNKITRQLGRLAKKAEEDPSLEDAITRLLRKRAAISSSAGMRIPVTARIAENHKAERTIIFHERIKSAKAITSILTERGFSVTQYHTKIGADLRQENLRLFRRGIFDCLVTCRALDEGINVPDVTIAIVASSTSSTRQRIQRLGRVLRPSPGKERATVYTIYATPIEERRLAKEAAGLQDAADVQWMKGAKKTDA